MENQNEIFNEGRIDIEIIRKLRREKKYEEVYKELRKIFYSNRSTFATTQYLISIIDYKPFYSNEIKKVSDLLLSTKKKYFGYFGFVMYYLSINDVQNAYDYYQLIKDESFYANLVNQKLNKYNCGTAFRKMIFDIDAAIKEIESEDISIKNYILKTFDIGEHYFEIKDYNNAIKYYKLSCEKRYEEYKPFCYFRIAKCYYRLCDYENCKMYYLKTLESLKNSEAEKDDNNETKTYNKQYYKCLYEYIFSLIGFNDYDNAFELTKILDTGTEKDRNMSLYLKGKIYRKTKKYNEAINIFDVLLEKGGLDKKSACAELIKVYSSLGDEEKATKYMDMMYEEFPDQTPTIKMTFYFDSFKYKECVEFCKNYINTKYDKDAKFHMGRSLLRIGEYEKAYELLYDIKDRNVNSLTILELGFISEKLGYFEEAFNYYNKFINLNYKSNNINNVNKGLKSMIEFLCNQYEFVKAREYLNVYESINEDQYDYVNYINAIFYFRKQDFEASEMYFKRLFNTEYENEAKNYLTVIYRYTNEKDKALELFDELKDTEYKNEVELNKAKYYKDEHTTASLSSALYTIKSLKDTKVRNMAISEELQILIKLGYYDKAEKVLEEAYETYAVNKHEYYKYKSYIRVKTGYADMVEPENRTIFINYSIEYDIDEASRSNMLLNESNKGKREFNLNDNELDNLFYELSSTLDYYNYYISDLYDVYVIDMGKIIGTFYGIETSLVEVKCEQNTHNIHLIQPTLKKINLNKYRGYQRTKTDLQ